jgi:Cu+-exporting ATPase
MVYDILHANELDQFYDIEKHPGVKTDEEAEPGMYDFLADPEVKRRLLDFTDGRISRVTLHVPQIHCVACVWLLEHLYKLHDGIGQPEVNFTRKTVMIPFEEAKITLVELAALLRKIGYAPDLKLEALNDRAPDTGRRTAMLQLGVAGFAFGNIMLLSFPGYLGLTDADELSPVFAGISLALSIPVLLFSARDYFRSAWLGLKQGELSIDVPIALGIIALFLQSVADIFTRTGAGYLDSMAGLVFFLLIGKNFQRRTFDALSFDRDYTSYFPIAAMRVDPDTGARATVSLDRIAVGDRLFIRNEELIPADAILLRTPALIDYSFVTGESRPEERQPGELLYAGGRHHGPPIEIDVVKDVSQSYLTSLWNHKSFRKENERKFDKMTGQVSRVFTLVVLLIALGAGLIHAGMHTGHAVRVFASILIVACPCALALSAPFAFGTALRVMRRHRLFLKNGSVVEGMSRIRHLAFDKTGTLTRGGLGTASWQGSELSPALAKAFGNLARTSTHPLSRALADHLPAEPMDVSDLRELPGKGLEARWKQHTLRMGALSWLQSVCAGNPPQLDTSSPAQTWLAVDDEILGVYQFEDLPRDGVARALAELDDRYDISILTGDRAEGLEALRTWFPNAKDMRAGLSPEEKLAAMDELRHDGKGVMMVGDGLNDAGALRHSDVGIAVTENIQAFSPACDAILQADAVALLPRFLAFSQDAARVVIACFAVSLLYNVVGISIAATGHLSPLLAAILMPLSSASVVLLSVFGTRAMALRSGL